MWIYENYFYDRSATENRKVDMKYEYEILYEILMLLISNFLYRLVLRPTTKSEIFVVLACL